MLVFAILESCISFAAQEVMANATDDIARQLRTGQLRAADVTETSLKKAICDRLEIMVAKGCPDLVVDLREFRDLRCRRCSQGEAHQRTTRTSTRPDSTSSRARR